MPRGIYTQNFRAQAERLHEVDGLTIPEVAKRLSLPRGTLKSWVYAARRGRLGEMGKNQKPPTELEMELARVKRGLAEVKMGRGLLNTPQPTSHEGRDEVRSDEGWLYLAGLKDLFNG